MAVSLETLLLPTIEMMGSTTLNKSVVAGYRELGGLFGGLIGNTAAADHPDDGKHDTK